MKESFGNTLNQAAVLHREKKHAADETMGNAALGKLVKLIDGAAGAEATTQAVQFEILYALQNKKQEIMDQLHEQLARLDESAASIETSPDAFLVSYDPQRGYQYQAPGGVMESCTIGTILTDVQWGISYQFDDTAPRADVKRYLLEVAKHDIRELLDQQIRHNESNSKETHWMKREAYEAQAADIENGESEYKTGFLAEKMAEGFLAKLVIDADMPFTVDWADAYEDVEHKADFFIHKKDHKRSADVMTDSEGSLIEEDFAVQLTTNTSAEAKEQKLKQIERINETEGVTDAVLVIFSQPFVQQALRKWKEAGCPPGGPTAFMERLTKRKLFEELLQEMYTEAEIREMWSVAGRVV